MNYYSARAELRNPPRVMWRLVLLEMVLALLAGLALVELLAS